MSVNPSTAIMVVRIIVCCAPCSAHPATDGSHGKARSERQRLSAVSYNPFTNWEKWGHP